MSKISFASRVAASVLFLPGSTLAAGFTRENQSRRAQSPEQQIAKVQSASGEITSVSGSSFTLKTSRHEERSPGSQFQDRQPNVMLTFLIDEHTAINGKLRIGVTADVAYRTDSNGNNIALNVRIRPES